jgi:hypothetical protein
MKRSYTYLAAALLSLLVAVLYSLGTKSPRAEGVTKLAASREVSIHSQADLRGDPRQPEPLPPDTGAREPEPTSMDAASPAAPATTMGVYLKDFWGPNWPEIEAELRASGNAAALDLEIAPEDMPAPWEEVEALLERLLAERIEAERVHLPSRLGARRGGPWPEPPTAEFLVERARLGLKDGEFGDGELVRALDETRLLRAEIAKLESDLVDAYHAACLSLLRGKAYGKSHFFYLPSIERALTPPALEGRPRWNPTLVNYKGWTVVFQLYKQDNLGIEHMIEELRPLYTERDRAVAAALKR